MVGPLHGVEVLDGIVAATFGQQLQQRSLAKLIVESLIGLPFVGHVDLRGPGDLCQLAVAVAMERKARDLRCNAIGQQPQLRLDRKSTRLTPVTNAHLVCRLLLEKKKKYNKTQKTI